MIRAQQYCSGVNDPGGEGVLDDDLLLRKEDSGEGKVFASNLTESLRGMKNDESCRETR